MKDRLAKLGLLLLCLALWVGAFMMRYSEIRQSGALICTVLAVCGICVFGVSLVGRRRSSKRNGAFLFYLFPVAVVLLVYCILMTR